MEPNGRIKVFPMPLIGSVVDLFAVADHIKNLRPCTVYIEDVEARSKQAGVKTMFCNWQILLDAAAIAKCPVVIVSSKEWQKILPPVPKIEGETLEKRRQRRLKAYCAFAQDLYPQVRMVLPNCRVIHDGLAAALLIAHWAKQLPSNKGAYHG